MKLVTVTQYQVHITLVIFSRFRFRSDIRAHPVPAEFRKFESGTSLIITIIIISNILREGGW